MSHAEAVEQLAPTMGDVAGWYVDGLATLAEHPQAVVPTVEKVSGRPGTTFASWARAKRGRVLLTSSQEAEPLASSCRA
ncbi:hypothetical protein [Actinopolymorpha rutila]|uniref:Uncharacterized protein n=1 Tax=Actinopolymorpha rutila TaxID=446787 RepID=A0A852ZL56_9ACTN|nr:hypothetical protein [Actinopolymorpha rutila]NYH89930.1 hypothetical protein [Actinopolymorpha rutila]